MMQSGWVQRNSSFIADLSVFTPIALEAGIVVQNIYNLYKKEGQTKSLYQFFVEKISQINKKCLVKQVGCTVVIIGGAVMIVRTGALRKIIVLLERIPAIQRIVEPFVPRRTWNLA